MNDRRPRIADPRERGEEGLVEEPHHYLYSSARDEAGLPGMLKLETIWGEVITDHGDNLDADE